MLLILKKRLPDLPVHHAQTAAGVNRNAVGFNRDAARHVATKTSHCSIATRRGLSATRHATSLPRPRKHPLSIRIPIPILKRKHTGVDTRPISPLRPLPIPLPHNSRTLHTPYSVCWE